MEIEEKSLTLECHNLFIGLSYTLEKLQTLSTHNNNTTHRITAENFFHFFSDFLDKWHRWLTVGVCENELSSDPDLQHWNHAERLWWSSVHLYVKESFTNEPKQTNKQNRTQHLTTHTPAWMFACAPVSMTTTYQHSTSAAQSAHVRAVFSPSQHRVLVEVLGAELLIHRRHRRCHLKWPFTLKH